MRVSKRFASLGSMSDLESAFKEMAISIAGAAGQVGDYCDSVEHNEAADRERVIEAGLALREGAFSLSEALGLDLLDLYAKRLESVELRGPVSALSGAFVGSAAAREARTWLDLQLVQIQHDRYYHRDVAGLSKYDQLRHYAFHLAKLTSVYVAAITSEEARTDVIARRLADTLLFGLTLATVMSQRLDDEPFSGRAT